MGYMKSLVIDRQDDKEEFRLLFEIEPELPDTPELFASSSLTSDDWRTTNETSLPF
jgi:hypothetical protein